jgi:hypothetical protein
MLKRHEVEILLKAGHPLICAAGCTHLVRVRPYHAPSGRCPSRTFPISLPVQIG